MPDQIMRVQGTSFTMAGMLLAYNGAQTVSEVGRAHMPSGLEMLVQTMQIGSQAIAVLAPQVRADALGRCARCYRKCETFVVCILPHLLREAQRVLSGFRTASKHGSRPACR